MILVKKLSCIMLVDDDHDDNVYHQLIIKRMDIAESTVVVNDGFEALAYLKKQDRIPELIFLDINMPKMNGWEFLEEYKNLDASQKAKTVIMMLSTTSSPEEIKKAKEIEEVTGFRTKPLSPAMLTEIIQQYFGDHLRKS